MADAAAPFTKLAVARAGTAAWPSARAGCRAAVHFRAWTAGGALLDDSRAWGQPFELRCGREFVIPRWVDARRSPRDKIEMKKERKKERKNERKKE